MDVQAYAIQSAEASPEAVLADDVAFLIGQLLVEGACQDAVGREAGGLAVCIRICVLREGAVVVHMACCQFFAVCQALAGEVAAHKGPAAEAVGAVLVLGGGLGHGLSAHGLMEAAGDDAGDLIPGELVEQLIPKRIVVCYNSD